MPVVEQARECPTLSSGSQFPIRISRLNRKKLRVRNHIYVVPFSDFGRKFQALEMCLCDKSSSSVFQRQLKIKSRCLNLLEKIQNAYYKLQEEVKKVLVSLLSFRNIFHALLPTTCRNASTSAALFLPTPTRHSSLNQLFFDACENYFIFRHGDWLMYQRNIIWTSLCLIHRSRPF